MALDLNPREYYGQLSFVNNNIESITGDIDIEIGLEASTGRLKLNRNVVLARGKTLGLEDHSSPYDISTLAVIDGVLKVVGANGFQVGQILIDDNTIESTSGSTDLVIGVTGATADLVLNRNVLLARGKTLSLEDHSAPYNRVALSMVSGVLIVGTGGLGLRVGDIEIYQDTIESASGSVDFKIGNTTATANLVIGRNVVHAAGKTIAFSGVAGVQSTPYLGTATVSQIGGVQPDGTTITISSGIISAVPSISNSFTSTVTTQASTLTVDVAAGPSVIFWQPGTAGNRAVTLTNFSAGKSVKIFITPKDTNNTFTFTSVTGSQCSNGSNVYRLAAGGAGQSSMMIEIFSTTALIGGVWISAHGGV